MNKITIEKSLCIGCGACISVAPETFDWDDDGKAKVISNNVTSNVENARDYCPTGAIKISVEAINTEDPVSAAA